MEFFKEDPPPRRKGFDYGPLLDAAKANPGEWIKHPDQMGGASSARAQTIRQGRVRTAQPAGVFEATSRAGYLYVRYVGGQS